MSSRLLLLLLLPLFSSPKQETEWWYFTGNLQSADGRHYGYELTFFRQANTEPEKSNSIWNSGQLYLAHLALSDLDGQKFEHFERLNRAGPGLAGVLWNGNWNVRDNSLQAIASDFTLKLTLNPAKPYVTHGVGGVSRKGPGPDQYSHYVSFTRLATSGTLVRDGKPLHVTGTSWMDHEDFTESQDSNLRGWDWFAIQLDNNQELMLYRLRLKSGAVSPYSSGTFIDANGQPHHLAAGDFSLTPAGYWRTYPVAWHLDVPSLAISLDESTRLKNQELDSTSEFSPPYWEGAVSYQGAEKGSPVKGTGYLEMTGYEGALRLGH